MDKWEIARRLKDAAEKRKAICPICGSEQVTLHIMHAVCRTCGKSASFTEMKKLVAEYDKAKAEGKV